MLSLKLCRSHRAPALTGLMLSTVGAFMLLASPASAQGPIGDYSVELNKTEIVRLPARAGTVVIGNPDIADVTVQSSQVLLVVGRGYGETNLIVLDEAGNTMMNTDIQVINTLPAQGVRLYGGKTRETYNCQPFCQPAPVLGDDPAFIGNFTAESQPSNPITALFEAMAEGAETSATGNAGSSGTMAGGDPSERN